MFKMSKCTNLDIKHAAYLHIVHNLQHPTSPTTTNSTKTTMVNTLKNNFSPLPAGRYGKLTKLLIQRRHQANEGNSGLEAEKIQNHWALRSLRSKNQLAVEKGRSTHLLSNEEKEKCIEEYVERETAGARKRVEDAEAAVQQ